MNILVTGAKGMVGKALVENLKNVRDNKYRIRPELRIKGIYEYDIDSTDAELDDYCQKADFVFNLAGVNRPKDNAEFMQGNCGFGEKLLETLKKYGSKVPVMLSSSIQASLIGRYGESDYGKSKLAGEELFFRYGEETGVKVAVYRFPNLMGHSRPNYNSAVSTFCNAVANDLPFSVNDRSSVVELLYIDDLVEAMFDLLEGREKRCDYDGLTPVENDNGKYCYVPLTYTVTLGEIVDLLEQFKAQQTTQMMPSIPDGSFAKKLYSLYLTYLPASAFKYPLKINSDHRGSFTTVLKTLDHGQFSVNISKPGVTKGQHWHNSKWELFIVVAGRARIEERNIYTNEKVVFEVSGTKIEAVHMIPGWAHNIINLSDSDPLVTLMWANEVFDSGYPDTFHEPV